MHKITLTAVSTLHDFPKKWKSCSKITHDCVEFVSDDNTMIMRRNASGFIINCSHSNGKNKRIAAAISTACHPSTVFAGEWSVLQNYGYVISDLKFYIDPFTTTEENPISLHMIGFDFFMRHKTTKRIWFISPISGETVHSGAKGNGGSRLPGKRFCSYCNLLISANNLVTQHIKSIHPEIPIPGESEVDFLWSSVSNL